MARMKIELPESFLFSTDVEVRITDINYGQHLGNDSLLGLLHEARVRFLRHRGLSEADVGGAGLIMTDAAIVFKSQAFLGDPLRIEIAVAEPGRIGFDLLYRMTHRTSGVEIARARTGMAFFDYAARRIVGMPDGFPARIGLC